MLAALPFMLRVIAEVNERVVALGGLHHHVAASPAVSTRGAAAGNKLLSPESHAAVAAVAGLHSNFCFIDKHDGLGIPGPLVRCWFGGVDSCDFRLRCEPQSLVVRTDQS